VVSLIYDNEERTKYTRHYGDSKDYTLFGESQKDPKAFSNVFASAVTTIPNNIAQGLLRDTSKTNFNSIFVLREKIGLSLYDYWSLAGEHLQFINPRKKDFYKNLRLMDLNSQSYLEPLITDSDFLIEKYLSPFFDDRNDAEKRNAHYQKLEQALNEMKDHVRSMPVPQDDGEARSVKAERLVTFVNYLELIKDKADVLNDPNASNQNRKDAVRMIYDWIGQQKIRKDNTKKQGAEYVRKFKRQLDQFYVNPHVRRLPFKEAKTKPDNSENFFLLPYGMLFDDNGDPLDVNSRQPNFVSTFAEQLANMYRSGREEYVLRLIQVCKFREGAGSQLVLPGGFVEEIRKQLEGDFSNAKDENGKRLNINEDDNYGYFEEKLKDIVNARQHSPEAGGGRETEDVAIQKLFKYMSGRLFAGYADQSATPETQKAVSIPIMKARQRFWAYCLGGTIGEINKKDAKTTAEKECGTTINWNKGFWWKEKVDKDDGNASPEDLKYNSIVDRAPLWMMPAMLPIRAVSSLYYLPGKAAKKAFIDNKWGRRLAITTVVTGLTTGACVLFPPLAPAALSLAGAAITSTPGMIIGGVTAVGVGAITAPSIRNFAVAVDQHKRGVYRGTNKGKPIKEDKMVTVGDVLDKRQKTVDSLPEELKASDPVVNTDNTQQASPDNQLEFVSQIRQAFSEVAQQLKSEKDSLVNVFAPALDRLAGALDRLDPPPEDNLDGFRYDG